MELVERDEHAITAQIRATAWSSRYRGIAREFRTATGTAIAKGMKILAEVEVSFHERYGLSLNIIDIDPSYTLGEMARRRKEVLLQLEKDGLIGKNKGLDFPLLPLKLAVISSPHAAGYEDFLNHIRSNPYAYHFDVTLIRATMQGDNAESSIMSALSRCAEKSTHYDLVLIIRGGGGEADLHCFDSYALGRAVALFPLPLVSGIGHFRDRTVVDEVAHTTLKTPTAAAGFVVQCVRDFEVRVDTLQRRFVDTCRSLIEDQKLSLYRKSKNMEKGVIRFLIFEEEQLRRIVRSLMMADRVIGSGSGRLLVLQEKCSALLRYRLRNEGKEVDHALAFLQNALHSRLEKLRSSLRNRTRQVMLLDPKNVMKRGYSITYHENTPLRDTKNISPGDIIRTVVYDGSFMGEVTEVESDD